LAVVSDRARPPYQRILLIVLPIVAAVGIGLFIVLGPARARTAGTAPVVSPPRVAGELRPGADAPDFSAPGFDGATVRLSALRGKVVLVNFFASWCIECRAEMPAIQAAYVQKRAAGFEVVGVDTWDSGDGKDFYHQMGATFPAVFDPQEGGRPGAIAHAFGLDTPALPTTVFVDRDGRVLGVYPGGIDAAIIAKELRQAGIS
jgi:cytochrome c biogenesis protein CcmG/thiol:disulfide interchange protein DsbE